MTYNELGPDMWKKISSQAWSNKKALFHSSRLKLTSSWRYPRLRDLASRWYISHFFSTNITAKNVSDTKDSLTTDRNLSTGRHLKRSVYIHESRWYLHPIMQRDYSWMEFLICFSRKTPRILVKFLSYTFLSSIIIYKPAQLSITDFLLSGGVLCGK